MPTVEKKRTSKSSVAKTSEKQEKKRNSKAVKNKETNHSKSTSKNKKGGQNYNKRSVSKTPKANPIDLSKKQSWRPGNLLYPLPAVMVSCGRKGEKPNIITIGWTGTICSDPAMVSISVRKERYSYDIIKETGEFVINLTTEDLCYATDYCGVKSGRDVDKFAEMKLTPSPSTKISCPGISESPVNIECVVKQVIELGSHTMFIAEVVAVNVSESYIDAKGKFNLNSTGLITYSHGEYYSLGDKLGTFGYSVKKK